ncbi:hypothetical protein BDQ94DRAFT_148611, partial [Aspergillus welwitschiae]
MHGCGMRAWLSLSSYLIAFLLNSFFEISFSFPRHSIYFLSTSRRSHGHGVRCVPFLFLSSTLQVLMTTIVAHPILMFSFVSLFVSEMGC